MGQKGQRYEREVCKKLSLWWSHGERDDLFWRTAGSGARATSRSKKGKQTYGQHGDICATDPAGESLLRLLSIEVKRGYSKSAIMDLIDKPYGAKVQQFEHWIYQASNAALLSEASGWLLIHKRDRRKALVFFPDWIWKKLRSVGCFDVKPSPAAFFYFQLAGGLFEIHHKVYCMGFDDFLEGVEPADVKKLVKK